MEGSTPNPGHGILVFVVAMGRKKRRQRSLFVSESAARAPGHRFYEKLSELLREAEFDGFVEGLCEPFFDPDRSKGRESVPPGVYFRMLMVGYFEGIESERGICWRCEDSLSLREFLGLGLGDRVPDHSTLSRTRTRFGKEVFEEVFRFILRMVEKTGLLKGRVAGVDSTYLQADASMKSIVRKGTGASYRTYLRRLAEQAGVEEPTDEDARRMDRTRAKTTSNADWESPTDSDARIMRMKDGRTRLTYKAEHVTDLETGAILSASVHPGDAADTATAADSLQTARENVLAAVEVEDDDDDDDARPSSGGGTEGSGLLTRPEVVMDKGYYKTELLEHLDTVGYRTYVPEPVRKHRRRWKGCSARMKKVALANRARTRRPKGRAHQRRRGEYLERSFAHVCETGAGRRTRLRGRFNVEKGYIVRAAAANLGLIMRALFGMGTPRGLAGLRALEAILVVARWVWATARRLYPGSSWQLVSPAIDDLTTLVGLSREPRLLRSTGC